MKNWEKLGIIAKHPLTGLICGIGLVVWLWWPPFPTHWFEWVILITISFWILMVDYYHMKDWIKEQ